MNIKFFKAHGARNDFLLTWENEVRGADLNRAAEAICDRHAGVGADGWLLVSRENAGPEYDGRIRLFNPDGGEVEISGNGTRCAAAFLLHCGLNTGLVRILTGAGVKHLRLLERAGLRYQFEMNMGTPAWSDDELRFPLELHDGTHEVTILNVGNPQCAVFVEHFEFDWRNLGVEIERHPHFPKRTNVSFIRPVDRHTIEVRIWERGAGETLSSGTGSTGAAVASRLRGLVENPVRILTPAGPLDFRWEGSDMFLVGPAEIVASGEFHFEA
jgi:diaminopimelate epimerase